METYTVFELLAEYAEAGELYFDWGPLKDDLAAVIC